MTAEISPGAAGLQRPPAIKKTAYPRLSRVRWRWEDDGQRKYIIFATARRELYLLNPVASLIFASCDGTRHCDEISRHIGQRYSSMPEHAVLGDVMLFVQSMVNQGICVLDDRKAE